MEVAPTVLKAGMGIGSLIFGKPKLNEGTPVGAKTDETGLPVPVDPKIFCSYSCSCWYTATLRNKEMKVSDTGELIHSPANLY